MCHSFTTLPCKDCSHIQTWSSENPIATIEAIYSLSSLYTLLGNLRNTNKSEVTNQNIDLFMTFYIL